MIFRGKKLYPHLDMRLIDNTEAIPFANESIDAVIMSTVLCCILDDSKQKELIAFKTMNNNSAQTFHCIAQKINL